VTAERRPRRFADLTLIGQGRRLRPAARSLLEAHGISPRSLRQLTDATNIVYRVDATDDRTYVLRLTSPKSCHSIENIRSEIEWMQALCRETRLGIPEPVPNPAGTYVIPLKLPDVPGHWHATVFRWVPGTVLDRRRSRENVFRHGMLMASLHAHAARFDPGHAFRIRPYDTVFPYSNRDFPPAEPIVILGEAPRSVLPVERRDLLREAHARVQREIDALFSGPTQPRVIHNDLHVWNVKVTREAIYALDFEDLLTGFPIQDNATALYYYRYRPEYEAYLDAFRAGYESVRAWPAQDPGSLETLMIGRLLLLANFVLASEDASDRALAPKYLGTVEKRVRAYLKTLS
jgi:Ser/Thr protein kinase RdoA (MazF antagonist)